MTIASWAEKGFVLLNVMASDANTWVFRADSSKIKQSSCKRWFKRRIDSEKMLQVEIFEGQASNAQQFVRKLELLVLRSTRAIFTSTSHGWPWMTSSNGWRRRSSQNSYRWVVGFRISESCVWIKVGKVLRNSNFAPKSASFHKLLSNPRLSAKLQTLLRF